MTDLTTDRAAERRETGLLPDPGDRHDQPGEPPSALPGVPLTRLISLARLTPAQALEIAASLLAAATRSQPDSGSPGGGRVVVDHVVVGADGQVALGPILNGRHDGRPPGAGPATEAVLADLAAAARPRRADPAAEQLQAALDQAAANLPGDGVLVVARRLEMAADAIDRRAVRAELAALVRALGGGAGPARGIAAIGARAAAAPAAPAGPAPTTRARSGVRRVGAWVLSVLVLTAVVLLEVVLLRDDISTDIDALLKAGRSGSESSIAPVPEGPPIGAPAPAAAGNVTAVDLRATGPCAPDAPCTLRLLVRLVPGADQQVVTWSYRIVDPCTGASSTAPGGSVTVPAQGERAVAVATVALPALPAVAVIAVTDTPAVAASAPVLVGSCPPDEPAQ